MSFRLVKTERGKFELRWSTIDTQDKHPIYGSLHKIHVSLDIYFGHNHPTNIEELLPKIAEALARYDQGTESLKSSGDTTFLGCDLSINPNDIDIEKREIGHSEELKKKDELKSIPSTTSSTTASSFREYLDSYNTVYNWPGLRRG